MSVPVRTVITTKNGGSFGVNEDYARVTKMLGMASPLATPGFYEFTDGDGERVLIAADQIASVCEGRGY